MRSVFAILALIGATSSAVAADRYVLDASHSQVVFSFEHLGFSTTYGMFSGFEGEILFDQQAPEMSSVAVSIPVSTMFTGWEERDSILLSSDFFAASEGDVVSFVSTKIEVTGEETAIITGDLSINGIVQDIALSARLNKLGAHPLTNAEWAGFDATASLKRSDFGLGAFAPAISDDVEITVSIEAMKVD